MKENIIKNLQNIMKIFWLFGNITILNVGPYNAIY